MNFKNTYKQFGVITNLIIKGLRQQLSSQEYHATGKLSRSFTGVSEKLKNDNIILNITSNKDYWRVVNDPRVAFSVNKQNIVRWMNTKGLDKNFANAVYKRLARGNSLQRSNFAGIVALEESNKVAQELAHSIGEDVADMIREEIRKIKPKAQIS